VVIAGDREDVLPVNDLNYLKHMMSLNPNRAGARTVKWTTGV